MNYKISVVIRNKNQAKELEFLLMNLNSRYGSDISEIIVIDNLSTDNSREITEKFKAKFITIKNFSYGRSANLAAEKSKNDIVVIFSAHAYPVSHDFFEQILYKFKSNPNLAGLRCLHNNNDYSNFIYGITAKQDPNKSGLIFCGSAFNRIIWKNYKFRDNIVTMEDKEWSLRVIRSGYNIEFSPSIFCYQIKRSKAQLFLRFKNETIGAYQIWHQDLSLNQIIKSFLGSLFNIIKNTFIDLYYAFLRLIFSFKFYLNKPEKYK